MRTVTSSSLPQRSPDLDANSNKFKLTAALACFSMRIYPCVFCASDDGGDDGSSAVVAAAADAGGAVTSAADTVDGGGVVPCVLDSCIDLVS